MTDIDRIVAEVVRRLRSHSANSSTAAMPKADELNVIDKVITLRLLDGKLSGIKTLVVSERAVVTPAVKDELKQRGIVWQRATAQARTTARIGLLVASTDEAAANLLKSLRCPRIERIESGSSTSLDKIAKELARHATARQLPSLLVSSKPFAAVVAANKAPNIQAAVVATTADIDQATAEAKLNLFIVSALKTPPMLLKNLAQAISDSAVTKARS